MMPSILAAILCAAAAGVLVGLGESALVAATAGETREYWLFFFGVVSYGLVAAVLGAVPALLWQLVRRGKVGPAGLGGVAFACGAFLPVLAVSRYHVILRVFHEQLKLASVQGVVTHALLLVAAALVALLGGWLVAAAHRRAGIAGFAGFLVVAVAAAWLGGALTEAKRAQTVRRPAPGSAAGKPNIILIIADTLRADAVEPYGAPAGSTPAFADLARDSVVFERTVAQSSWTRPSIASILTGQHASSHRAVHKFDILPDEAFTLAEALRLQGYWTAGFVTNINVAPVFNFQQGFDEYVYLEPDFYFGATDSGAKLAIYKVLRLLREKLNRRIYFPHFYQDAEVLNRNALQWLESNPPEPFFLLMHYMDPHDPFFEIPYNGKGFARVSEPNPPAARARELHDLYLQDVRYLDRHLGNFLDRLKKAGLYDRSFVVLTADHGEEFQEHGGWWHGTTLYDETLRVPLLFKRPGGQGGGERRKALVRLIDIAPALMAAIGADIPAGFEGRDLFTAGDGGPIVAETDLEGNQVKSILRDGWKLILANPGNPRGLGLVELYDLGSDPGERQNLAAKQPERVARMKAELAQVLRPAATVSTAATHLAHAGVGGGTVAPGAGAGAIR